MSDDPSTADLVTGAAIGSKQAWDALVDRYAPLIWSICRTRRLGDTDAGLVGLAVWSQLASQLGTVRDPAALAGWLAITTARQCDQARPAVREQSGTAEQELRAPAQQTAQQAAQQAALREALTRLPGCCQQLIAMLAEDPPVPYGQISAELGVPVDSIGPTRRRCLDKLRRDPAIAALINPETTVG